MVRTRVNISLHPLATRHKSNKNWLRYLIWAGVAGTAYANQRHFRLPTTWVPHLTGNTFSLLLPELYRLVDHTLHLEERWPPQKHPTWGALLATFRQIVVENPDYLDYVAPAALAYIVSHPRFNIYRGDWGAIRVAGFGLDSIPHSSTAFALTNLMLDTIETLHSQTPSTSGLAPVLQWIEKNKFLVTGAVLAGLTIAYEYGEYRIRQVELEATHYDESRVNMIWSLQDCIFDSLSNAIGWLTAIWRRRPRP